MRHVRLFRQIHNIIIISGHKMIPNVTRMLRYVCGILRQEHETAARRRSVTADSFMTSRSIPTPVKKISTRF
jgi:hypothetical protein